MTLKLIFTLSSVFLFCFQNSSICPSRSLPDMTFVYWENLKENQKNDILNSCNISKDVLEFYKGNLNIGDNSQTVKLLNRLSSISDKEKATPLYFYLFNQICIKADGSLSEILGNYCQKIVLSFPSYVVVYLGKNEGILKKYAQYLGYELYFKEEGTSMIEYSYSDFKKMLSEKAIRTKQYSEALTLFYHEIEQIMNKMD